MVLDVHPFIKRILLLIDQVLHPAIFLSIIEGTFVDVLFFNINKIDCLHDHIVILSFLEILQYDFPGVLRLCPDLHDIIEQNILLQHLSNHWLLLHYIKPALPTDKVALNYFTECSMNKPASLVKSYLKGADHAPMFVPKHKLFLLIYLKADADCAFFNESYFVDLVQLLDDGEILWVLARFQIDEDAVHELPVVLVRPREVHVSLLIKEVKLHKMI